MLDIAIKRKKEIQISLIIAAVYFVFSLLYFFEGEVSLNPELNFRDTLEMLLVFPSTIIFSVGYGVGESAAFFTGIIIFISIWIISFLLSLMVFRVKKIISS